MVRNGWAIAYRYYSLDFVEDEKLAEKDKIGLWQGRFQEPYLYRKSKQKYESNLPSKNPEFQSIIHKI